jgi:hypothetical protein
MSRFRCRRVNLRFLPMRGIFYVNPAVCVIAVSVF